MGAYFDQYLLVWSLLEFEFLVDKVGVVVHWVVNHADRYSVIDALLIDYQRQAVLRHLETTS